MSQRRTMVNGHENHFLNVRTFIGNGSARNVRLRNEWNFFFFWNFISVPSDVDVAVCVQQPPLRDDVTDSTAAPKKKSR